VAVPVEEYLPLPALDAVEVVVRGDVLGAGVGVPAEGPVVGLGIARQMCVAEVMAWKSKVSWTSISGFGSAASAFWPSRLEDWSQTAESTWAAEGSALARTST
jgi:hypothetical protein